MASLTSTYVPGMDWFPEGSSPCPLCRRFAFAQKVCGYKKRLRRDDGLTPNLAPRMPLTTETAYGQIEAANATALPRDSFLIFVFLSDENANTRIEFNEISSPKNVTNPAHFFPRGTFFFFFLRNVLKQSLGTKYPKSRLKRFDYDHQISLPSGYFAFAPSPGMLQGSAVIC